MNRTIYDPRKRLADKLYESGLDFNKALLIAVDAGLGLVNKKYLQDYGLQSDNLAIAENIIKEFNWYMANHD